MRAGLLPLLVFTIVSIFPGFHSPEPSQFTGGPLFFSWEERTESFHGPIRKPEKGFCLQAGISCRSIMGRMSCDKESGIGGIRLPQEAFSFCFKGNPAARPFKTPSITEWKRAACGCYRFVAIIIRGMGFVKEILPRYFVRFPQRAKDFQE